MLTNGCHGQITSVKEYLCDNTSNACQNFICATNKFRFDHMVSFYHVNEFCMFPKESLRKGIFEKGLDLIKCSAHEDSYCHQGLCISDKKFLKNCKEGRCTTFDNSYVRPINKLLYFPEADLLYNYFEYWENGELMKDEECCSPEKTLYIKDKCCNYTVLIIANVSTLIILLGVPLIY
ncbi:hypothetical protein HZS_3430, partial [Henneguya salminicola]